MAILFSVLWSIICLVAGVESMNLLLSNEEYSVFISIIMPLYFMLWFGAIWGGHIVIRKILEK